MKRFGTYLIIAVSLAATALAGVAGFPWH